MSGGFFDYRQFHLSCIEEELRQVIKTNRIPGDAPNDKIEQTNYFPDTINEFKKALQYIQLARIYITRIDYLLSGDDGESSFHKRLKQDLNEPPTN